MQRAVTPDEPAVTRWARRATPGAWFVEPAEILTDDLEILVIGRLPGPPAGSRDPAAAAIAAIEQFRRDSRPVRVRISADGERRFGRRVSWGARCGGVERLFTGLSVPVMTRLRLPERVLLDTLVDGGVARSRSEALAWCARLVAANEGKWIERLRAVVEQVKRVRNAGPQT